MTRITEKGQGAPLEVFASSTDTSLKTLTGARFDASDGREFVLVYNSSAGAQVAGNLIQGPAKVDNHINRTLSTAAIGATSLTIALGATAATANQYQGGFLVINAGTGQGQTLKIASHLAADSSGTLTLNLEDPLQVATATGTSKGSLWANPYYNVVICPTTLTGTVIGVTISPIAVSTYALIQTKGLVACLNDANTAIGLDLMPSANTAGAVATYVVATSSRVGTSCQAGVTTENRIVNIQL